MVAPAVEFFRIVLAVHIAAVAIAFGVMFAYPVIGSAGARLDPRAMPWFHLMQHRIGQRLISPGLLIVVLAGLYLAGRTHAWHAFYVQWGIGVALVLGGLSGAFISPSQKRLAELAERDLAAAGDGDVIWSADYEMLNRRVTLLQSGSSLLVLVTVYLMTVQSGA